MVITIMEDEKKGFIKEINLLRGYAIFTIVSTHIQSCISKVADDNIFYNIFSSLQVNNTVIFVFISGFLFQYIYLNRDFNYQTYLKKKFQNIVCPYLFNVLIFIILAVTLTPYLLSNLFGNRWFWSNVTDFVRNTFQFWALWYVPFIILIFILAPVFLELKNFKLGYQFAILFFLSLLSAKVGRNNWSPIQSVLYFFSIYTIGMFCALKYENWFNKIYKFRYIAYLFFVFFTIFYNFPGLHNLINNAFINSLLQYYYKITQCFVFLFIFKALDDSKLNFLKKIFNGLAKYSFAIFFMHNYVIYVLVFVFDHYKIISTLSSKSLVVILCFLGTIIVCYVIMGISLLVKKIIGIKSKYFIGA